MIDTTQDTRKIVYISLLVAMSVVLHTLEQMIPLPSPWIKFGISNIATLLALVLLGFKEAIIVTLLRVLIGSILFGTFLNPTFMLSLMGGYPALL
jgi:heptaprenyl diphosphate synthase